MAQNNATAEFEQVISELPEEHQGKVTQLIAGMSSKFEEDLSALRSSHDTARSEDKKRLETLEMELAGLRDQAGSVRGGLNNELTDSQRAILDARNRQTLEAQASSEAEALRKRLQEAEEELFAIDKKAALQSGIPESVVNRAKDRSNLDDLITIYRAARGVDDGMPTVPADGVPQAKVTPSATRSTGNAGSDTGTREGMASDTSDDAIAAMGREIDIAQQRHAAKS